MRCCEDVWVGFLELSNVMNHIQPKLHNAKGVRLVKNSSQTGVTRACVLAESSSHILQANCPEGGNSVFSQGLLLVSVHKGFICLVLVLDPNPLGQVRKYPNLKTSGVHDHLMLDSLRLTA